MKKTMSIAVLALLVCAGRVEGAFGNGFSKIWEGTKEVVSTTYNTVTSPFRSGEDEKATKDKKSKDDKKKTDSKKAKAKK
jgi:hypothetical protein